MTPNIDVCVSAADGQHVYLHSVNARCLAREYGSLENSPHTITATIVAMDSFSMTEVCRVKNVVLAVP